MKTKIVVFTAWPQLLIGSSLKFEVLLEQPVEQGLIATFGSADIDQGMERYAVRIHDRNLYPEYEYCLFVNQPIELDLEKLIGQTDAEHTAYVAQDRLFVLYRRGKSWQTRDIFFHVTWPAETGGRTTETSVWEFAPENTPDRLGIIFVDCWQTVQDTTEWKHLPIHFDLYQTMIDKLSKYQADNLVFHTGEFGSHSLSSKLKPWSRQGNAVDFLKLESWTRHYQARELYNWMVVGAHWQRCTHEKPLGFYNLLDIKKLDPRLRVFSHMDCTVKFLNNDLENPIATTCCELDYQQDTLQWKITGRVAELVGPL